eukprot:CAMPEP_0205857196 /NCGR_PEP_ID=MMETSP1083-20121108/3533_1 /ASSEMBLY_ACC=CAM_ASM_000430 /TAXON_ID=97485 /ORGANISM="Prymnesium parvum, Strain Texoma1" /LENGTH=80 /DNA_ID=CAMNT_0053218669 /DNA_START=1267 /DNA_END=1509 /DNA_ORIENTATION=-
MITFPDVMCMAPPFRAEEEFLIIQPSAILRFPEVMKMAPPFSAVECKMRLPSEISKVPEPKYIAPPSDASASEADRSIVL